MLMHNYAVIYADIYVNYYPPLSAKPRYLNAGSTMQKFAHHPFNCKMPQNIKLVLNCVQVLKPILNVLIYILCWFIPGGK